MIQPYTTFKQMAPGDRLSAFWITSGAHLSLYFWAGPKCEPRHRNFSVGFTSPSVPHTVQNSPHIRHTERSTTVGAESKCVTPTAYSESEAGKWIIYATLSLARESAADDRSTPLAPTGFQYVNAYFFQIMPRFVNSYINREHYLSEGT